MNDKIIEKLTSGRFIATVSVMLTYCAVVAGSVFLVVIGKISVEVFLGIFSGFSGLAGLIINSYFERKDRAPEKPINA